MGSLLSAFIFCGFGMSKYGQRLDPSGTLRASREKKGDVTGSYHKVL